MQNVKIVNKTLFTCGRVTTSSLMNMVEVKPCAKRDICNWINDTYDNHYSSKLPLSTMRVVAGFNTRCSYHYNATSNFFGVDKHKCLPLFIFNFIENKLDNTTANKKIQWL